MKNKIRNEIDKNCKPKEIVHTILSQQGSIHEITAPGQHVKNRQQVSNFRYAMKEERNNDQLLYIMDVSKEQSLDRLGFYERGVCIP